MTPGRRLQKTAPVPCPGYCRRSKSLAEIVRSEVRLVRVELRQDFAQVANASTFLAIAAVFALFGLGFILLGVMYALGTSIALWLSAVIVGVGAGLSQQFSR